jgi:hypothetical protein
VKTIGLVHNVLSHTVLEFSEMNHKFVTDTEIVLILMYAIVMLVGLVVIAVPVLQCVMGKVQQIHLCVQEEDLVYQQTNVNVNKIGLVSNVK